MNIQHSQTTTVWSANQITVSN